VEKQRYLDNLRIRDIEIIGDIEMIGEAEITPKLC